MVRPLEIERKEVQFSLTDTQTKPRKLLGLLYRQFANTNIQVMVKLYLSLVTSHLEYGDHVWHPHFIKDKNALESVQKFGLHICSRKWTESYQELLDIIISITLIRKLEAFLSLSTFFKIIHNLIYFPPNYYPFPLS